MSAQTQATQARHGWKYRALFVSIGLTALGYLALSMWAGWSEFVHAVSAVGVIGTAIALGLSLVNYLLRFFRWQNYLRLLGHKVPWRPSLRIYMSGFALATTPAKAGEMVRSIFLKRFGMTYPESLAAFFAERLCDLCAIVVLAAIGLSAHATAQPIVIGCGAILVAILLTLHNRRWLERLDTLGHRLKWRRLREFWVSVIEMVMQFRRCFALPVMSYSMLLSVLAWGAEAYSFYLVATWMGADLSLTEALFIFAFSTLVGALSFLPGGLGGTEAVMISLLLLNGMPEPQAIVCTLFIRVTTLWFAVALGLVALPHKK